MNWFIERGIGRPAHDGDAVATIIGKVARNDSRSADASAGYGASANVPQIPYIILFTDTFFGPLDGDLVVGGKGFHPVLVVIGTLSDHLLAQDGNADHLAKEMNHLLGPRPRPSRRDLRRAFLLARRTANR